MTERYILGIEYVAFLCACLHGIIMLWRKSVNTPSGICQTCSVFQISDTTIIFSLQPFTCSCSLASIFHAKAVEMCVFPVMSMGRHGLQNQSGSDTVLSCRSKYVYFYATYAWDAIVTIMAVIDQLSTEVDSESEMC